MLPAGCRGARAEPVGLRTGEFPGAASRRAVNIECSSGSNSCGYCGGYSGKKRET